MTEPAYRSLADELAALAASVPSGSRLPSENELVASHGVSRLTARAALQELEQRHVVRRVRGAGTFTVRRAELQVGSGGVGDWPAAVRSAGAEPRCEDVSTRTRRPAAGLRADLDLDEDERVTTVALAASIDGVPACQVTSHLPAELVAGLVDQLEGVLPGGVSHLLRAGCGLEPVLSRVVAELVLAPVEVAAGFGLDGRPHVWRVDARYEDPRLGRPVEVARWWLRADLQRVVLRVEASGAGGPG